MSQQLVSMSLMQAVSAQNRLALKFFMHSPVAVFVVVVGFWDNSPYKTRKHASVIILASKYLTALGIAGVCLLATGVPEVYVPVKVTLVVTWVVDVEVDVTVVTPEEVTVEKTVLMAVLVGSTVVEVVLAVKVC